MAASVSVGSSSLAIAQLADIRMAEQAVVVERHLGVQAQHRALLGHDQGIDLDQRSVGFVERAIHRIEQRHELIDLFVLQPQRKRDFARLERGHTDYRIDRIGDDLIRRLGGHFLDIHAAFGAGNHGHGFGLAIDQHRQVQLARNLAGLLQVEFAHHPALRPGLMGHQRFVEQPLGEFLGLGCAADQLDATGFAAPSGMNLHFGDGLGLSERLEGRFHFGRRGGGLALGYRRAEPPQNLLGLKLMYVHRYSSRSSSIVPRVRVACAVRRLFSGQDLVHRLDQFAHVIDRDWRTRPFPRRSARS